MHFFCCSLEKTVQQQQQQHAASRKASPSVGVIEEHEQAPVQQPAPLLKLLQRRRAGKLDAALQLAQQYQGTVPVGHQDLKEAPTKTSTPTSTHGQQDTWGKWGETEVITYVRVHFRTLIIQLRLRANVEFLSYKTTKHRDPFRYG